MAVRIQVRRGTASEWESSNPTLMNGELGFEIDTFQWKIGNGTDAWQALPYAVGFPNHEWDDTSIRFEKPDGTWGDWIDVKGNPGEVPWATPEEEVIVGPGELHTTINSALQYLSKKYPYYDGQNDIRAKILLKTDFVMEEQVLIDGQNLGWICLESEVEATTNIEGFSQGSVIPNSAQPEVSRIKIDYEVTEETTYYNTEFMNGHYVILETGGGDRHYYWFNSNGGGEDPGIDGTGHEVVVGLEDAAATVMTTLNGLIDGTIGFSASVTDRTMTVEADDNGDAYWTSTLDELEMTVTQAGTTDEHEHSFSVTSSEDDGHTHGVPDTTDASSSSAAHTHTGSGETSIANGHSHPFSYTTSEDDGSVPHTHTVSDNTDEVEAHTHSFSATTTESESDTPQVQIAEFVMEDYEVKEAETEYVESATVLNGSYVTLQTADEADHYFWFNVDAGASDPALSGTGHEITLTETDEASTATSDLNTAIDAVTGFTTEISGGDIYVTNDENGSVDSVSRGGTNVYVATMQSGSDIMYVVQVTVTAHGYSDNDRVVIINHEGDIEEVDYNGIWYIANVTGNTFELQGSVYTEEQAGAILTGEVYKPDPTTISREHLTEQWEFFYYPAFGVARGTLPLINCEFEMDTSGSNAYMSYKDGFCATDGGKMNFMPYSGCTNAGGSNIYGTRSSIINANDAIADKAGRHGIWAYSNTILNARRASASECGWAADENNVDHIDGIDEYGQSIGSGILAERGALINAEGCTVKDCYGDNILAAFGGIISLGGHGADLVLEGVEVGTGLDYTSTGSIHGKNINAIGGMLFDRDGAITNIKRYNEIKDTQVWSEIEHSIDLMEGNVHEVTLNGENVEITEIKNVLSHAHSFTLVVHQDSTEARTITYPSSVLWAYGSKPVIDGIGETYVMTFLTVDEGNTWLGLFAGGEFSGGGE